MELLKRLRPITVSVLAAGLLLGGTACTRVNDFQTDNEYTPAEGVPVDIEREPTAEEQAQQINPIPIKVSNLMIVEVSDGQGYVSGTVVSPIETQLESIEGQALDQSGAPISPLQINGSPTPVTADRSLILSTQEAFPEPAAGQTPEDLNADYTEFPVESADLEAGLLAEVTISFADGEATVQVPVVDGEKTPYQDSTQDPEPIEVSNE